MPELVVVSLDPGLAPAEPDQEVQDLLRASPGDNLGMDFLPGSLGLDVTVDQVDPTFAAQVLWLDALVQNVDRSWRNPNLLRWHRQPWLIDHGAALYWHHVGPPEPDTYRRPYPGGADHVLLPVAGPLDVAHSTLAPLLTPALVDEVTALVPESWLAHDASTSADAQRESRTPRCCSPGSQRPSTGSTPWRCTVPSAYEWAVLRAVPRVDRSEFVNVGVVVYCQALDFLEARDRARPRTGRGPGPGGRRWTDCAVISKACVRCAPDSSRQARTADARPASGSGGSSLRGAPSSSPRPCTPGSPSLRPMS